MGRKQKMKKAGNAAAGAAAANTKAAAASTALTETVAAASTTEDVKSEAGDMRMSMDKLMNLAETLQSSDAAKYQNDDSSDSDDAFEVLHSDVPKQKRGEKKARRLLMKLDLEQIPNVSRVIMRKAKNVLICIDHPDVYKCRHTKTIICFGEVRVEDTSNTATAQAAERYLNDVNVRTSQQVNDGNHLTLTNEDNEYELDEDNESDGGLDEKDIELVQMQSNCSRQKAIKALLKHNSDVVNAIMELTVE